MDASMDQLAMTSESQFNSTVLLEIDIWRDSNPGYFSSPTELCTSDFPMLLKIILHAGGLLGFKLLDFQSCRDHIIADFALAPILLDAYKTGLFFNLTSHPSFLPLKHDDDTEFESGPLVRSESDRSIKAAFEQKYIGNLPELFVDTLSKYSESASGVEASRRAYNRSISVIQSSGMGKSRLVEEAANLVFTIPINLREELANGTRAYPPPDIELREFFGTHALKSDALLQAEYAMFLMTLFDCVASEAKRLIMGSMGGTLAVKWANFLKEGQNIDDVGQNRKELYANVVCKTREKLAILETTTSPSGIKKLCNPTTLAFLFSDLRTSLNELLGVLGPPRHGRNLCYVYFDEAHGLTAKPPSNAGPLCHKSPYHNLGKVLSEICEQDTFFIFLSTNSNLRQFAPPPISHPSLRVSQGYTLFPPFTELPFDIFFPEMFKHILKTQKHATLDNVCTRGVMSSFGRPMWALHYKMWKEQQDTKDRFINGQLLNYGPALRDIITFAMDKLIAHGATDRVFQSKLAAISVRVGISFDSATELSRQIEAQLVESHMRIVYAIPEHREYMRTGSPSEPILAEAAARYLDEHHRFGIAHLGPEILSNVCQRGFLVRGERGELCGRLLVTVAHDIAIRNNSLGAPRPLGAPKPKFHQPVLVTDFLCALFAENYHRTVLGATPVTVDSGSASDSNPPRTLEEAFKDAYPLTSDTV
ncbi:hypothetical protein OPQ81_008646 [Rhizoctonia solani]|nr:hypothetical protein OPQ81_008646 [Rhizoctonia solani]